VDLDDVAVFVRVIDCGGFTRAADLLHQPKSRVSRTISALERRLGVALLYRTTRSLSVTEAGRALYEQCRANVYAIEGACLGLQERRDEVAGTLRLTTVESVADSVLGPLLAELHAVHPRLRVDLRTSNQIVDLVKDGIDVALRLGKLKDSALMVRPVGHIAMILVANPAYLRSAPPLRDVADLALHRALHFETGAQAATWTLAPPARRKGARAAEAEATTVAIDVYVRTSAPRVVLELALAGRGVALIPEYLCTDALADGRLVRLLAPLVTALYPVQFAWPAQREVNAKVRAFVDFAAPRLARYFAA
jgi:LysR family transcriptional regulator for bpeEF and oprC